MNRRLSGRGRPDRAGLRRRRRAGCVAAATTRAHRLVRGVPRVCPGRRRRGRRGDPRLESGPGAGVLPLRSRPRRRSPRPGRGVSPLASPHAGSGPGDRVAGRGHRRYRRLERPGRFRAAARDRLARPRAWTGARRPGGGHQCGRHAGVGWRGALLGVAEPVHGRMEPAGRWLFADSGRRNPRGLRWHADSIGAARVPLPGHVGRDRRYLCRRAVDPIARRQMSSTVAAGDRHVAENDVASLPATGSATARSLGATKGCVSLPTISDLGRRRTSRMRAVAGAPRRSRATR